MWLRRSILGATLALVPAAGSAGWLWLGTETNLDEVRHRVVPGLRNELTAAGLSWGAPILIRIFKESSELELWVAKGARFQLFKSFVICSFSGDLGPKLREGDQQSPEGFYSVGPEQMNPRSRYHLSFNLGYPNDYDQSHQRTGAHLMVHGDCVSVGCYAMTDPAIEEIYLMAEAAHDGGQPAFQVQAFPFRMTDANLTRHAGSPWEGFWQNLREGHDLFEQTGWPPFVSAIGGRYVFFKSKV